MRFEYEDGNLRIENAEGLRWQLNGADKPAFTFDYDALSVNEQRGVRRVGKIVQPLEEAQLKEVAEFAGAMSPPDGASMQAQLVADLRAFAHGLINTVVRQLEYDGLLDVAITGREGSTDLYAEEAGRILVYVDTVWNAYYGLTMQIQNTPDSELKSVTEYAEMMPFPPPMEHFSSGIAGGLFDAASRKR